MAIFCPYPVECDNRNIDWAITFRSCSFALIIRTTKYLDTFNKDFFAAKF